MTAADLDIAARRLQNQRLVGPGLPGPTDVVRWLGAVQSQDYLGAKWALAMRTSGWDNVALDREFDDGRLLRTHILRPTWHFVAPEDIRWLMALSGPRVLAGNAGRNRRLELDETTLRRGAATIVDRIGRNGPRTRHELGDALDAVGIAPTGQRLPHLLMYAELHGLICSGPLRGRQHTYALVDERAPSAPTMSREESVTELVRRYFASHGPATVHDFAWWSGLTVTDARRGLAALAPDVEQVTLDRTTWWTANPGPPGPVPAEPVVHLLPNYDEHLVAYRDHVPSQHPDARGGLVGRADLALGPHSVVVNGLVVGGWRRSVVGARVVVQTSLLVRLSEGELAGLARAVEQFGTFMGMPATLRGA